MMYRLFIAGTIFLLSTASGVRAQEGAIANAKSDQARIKEIDKLLNDLVSGCRKLLRVQKDIHRTIKITAGKKLKPAEEKTLAKLDVTMKDAIKDVTRLIKLVEAEGTALAFPELFYALRKDMKLIRHRVKTGDLGKTTQIIQNDIVETLKDMIKALTKF